MVKIITYIVTYIVVCAVFAVLAEANFFVFFFGFPLVIPFVLMKGN